MHLEAVPWPYYWICPHNSHDSPTTAISQRDITFYEHLQSSATRRRICSQILQFFNSTLAPGGTTATTNGAVGVGLSDYVFDAYLTRDLGRVFLVDINPFLPRTDPLLFAWEEIEEIAQAPSSVGSGVASSVPVVASVPIPSDGAGQDDANPDEVVAPRPHPAANAGDDDEESSDAASLASDEEEEEEEEEGSLDDGRLRFPLLRLLTSRAQAAQSYPTYAKNMVPSDVLNISDGAGIADFARRWAEEVAHAAVGDDASPVARLAQEGDLASRAPTRSTGEAPFDETLGPMPEH